MKFSRKKVNFLLSLFKNIKKKKKANCVLFFPVVLFGIASQSSQSSFFAGMQEILHTSLMVAFVALSSGD
jgi:hypothetical protein